MTNNKEAFTVPGVSDSAAEVFRYSQAVKRGNMLWIAGQAGTSKDGIVGVGDVEAQTRHAWQNIKDLVEAAGGTLHDLVETTTYLTDRSFSRKVNEIRCEVLPVETPPTSTILVVKELAHKDLLVEISAVAVLGD